MAVTRKDRKVVEKKFRASLEKRKKSNHWRTLKFLTVKESTGLPIYLFGSIRSSKIKIIT